jgi:hypothetical protein
MKKSELKKLLREEIRKVLRESITVDPSLVAKLKPAIAARKRDPEDENAHDALKNVLMQIYKKAGRKDASDLANSSMEDESTLNGSMSDVLSLIKDMLSEPASSSKASYIYDTLAKYDVASVTPKGTGTEIEHRFGDWKYKYAGSADEMYKDLLKAKAINKVGNKYIEKYSDSEDSLLKGIEANKRFKKI